MINMKCLELAFNVLILGPGYKSRRIDSPSPQSHIGLENTGKEHFLLVKGDE